jgi:hypothetical protein
VVGKDVPTIARVAPPSESAARRTSAAMTTSSDWRWEIVTNESSFALVSARDREAIKRTRRWRTAKHDLSESEHGCRIHRRQSHRSGW